MEVFMLEQRAKNRFLIPTNDKAVDVGFVSFLC